LKGISLEKIACPDTSGVTNSTLTAAVFQLDGANVKEPASFKRMRQSGKISDEIYFNAG
jgi:hypothetical protein